MRCINRQKISRFQSWQDFFIVKEFSCLGHGLPAGLAEVEMIERARAKRAW